MSVVVLCLTLCCGAAEGHGRLRLRDCNAMTARQAANCQSEPTFYSLARFPFLTYSEFIFSILKRYGILETCKFFKVLDSLFIMSLPTTLTPRFKISKQIKAYWVLLFNACQKVCCNFTQHSCYSCYKLYNRRSKAT